MTHSSPNGIGNTIKTATLHFALALALACPAPAPALAPQMQANSPLFKPDTPAAKVGRQFADILERGQSPVIVIDKNGTLTQHKKRIDTEMAERLVRLMAENCRLVLLTTNGKESIQTQVADIILSETLPAMNVRRAKLGQKPLSADILRNLTIYTMSGAQIWKFDTAKREYVQVYNLKVPPDQYKTVGLITNALCDFAKTNPLYKLPDEAGVRDLGNQFTLTAFEDLNTLKAQKKQFHNIDEEFGNIRENKTLRQLWQESLDIILNPTHSRLQESLESHMEIYLMVLKKMIAEKTETYIQPRFELETTFHNILYDGTEVFQLPLVLIHAINPRLKELQQILSQTPRDDYAARNRLTLLIDYWTNVLDYMNFPDNTKHMEHIHAADRLMAVIKKHCFRYGKDFLPIFVEIGGFTSIDVKFCSKGTGIKDIMRRFNAPGSDVIYFGDEFFPAGGDSTTLTSGAQTLVNVGRPINADTEMLKSDSRRIICTMANAGPEATARIFDLFIEKLEIRREQRTASCA